MGIMTPVSRPDAGGLMRIFNPSFGSFVGKMFGNAITKQEKQIDPKSCASWRQRAVNTFTLSR